MTDDVAVAQMACFDKSGLHQVYVMPSFQRSGNGQRRQLITIGLLDHQADDNLIFGRRDLRETIDLDPAAALHLASLLLTTAVRMLDDGDDP